MDYRTRVKYAFGVILFLLILGSYFILRPFGMAIASGLLLGYIFYPLHVLLHKGVKNKTFAATIVTLLVVALVFVPMFFFTQTAVEQGSKAANEITSRYSDALLFPEGECTEEGGLACKANKKFQELMLEPWFKDSFDSVIGNLRRWFVERAPAILLAVPKILLNLFIALLVMFAVMRDGPEILHKLRDLIPLSRKDEKKMFRRVDDTMHALVYGYIIAALVQGGLGTIALVIIGIESPFFWGGVMAFTSMVPFVGSAAVWLPIGIAQLVAGHTWQGVSLLLFGFFIIATVDNVIISKVINNRTQVSTVIILLGIIGGLSVFGFLGVIFGPLILTVTAAVLEIYPEDNSIGG